MYHAIIVSARCAGSSTAILLAIIDDFFAMEQMMANESLRRTMADYYAFVASGRREIYRIES